MRRYAARRGLHIVNGVGDVAKYLAEAASSIFKTTESDVPWSGTPFTGIASHSHDALITHVSLRATRSASKIQHSASHAQLTPCQTLLSCIFSALWAISPATSNWEASFLSYRAVMFNRSIPQHLRLHVAAAGSISHHEDVARLRKVYQIVQDARQQIVGGSPPLPV